VGTKLGTGRWCGGQPRASLHTPLHFQPKTIRKFIPIFQAGFSASIFTQFCTFCVSIFLKFVNISDCRPWSSTGWVSGPQNIASKAGPECLSQRDHHDASQAPSTPSGGYSGASQFWAFRDPGSLKYSRFCRFCTKLSWIFIFLGEFWETFPK